VRGAVHSCILRKSISHPLTCDGSLPEGFRMPTVHWNWALLTTTSIGGASHRVARRGSSAIVPPTGEISSGDNDANANASGWTWTPTNGAQAKPALMDASGKRYVFAFWSVKGGATGGMPVGSSIVNNRQGFSVPVGADNNASATAYYVWDFGPSGPGPNAVCIDAFDQDSGFIADDFVNVYPDDGKPHYDPTSLYAKANDGLLITDPPNADITRAETLTAFDVPGRRFQYWLEVEALTFPATNGPTLNGTDASIMPSCVLVAFGIYASTPFIRIPRLPDHGIYNPWWWIETHGGLTPPGPLGPEGPWMREYLAALRLAQMADRVSPTLRGSTLKLALEQLNATAALIKREMKNTPGRKRGR